MIESEPRWEILIATLGRRASHLRALLDQLLPQTVAYDGQVRVTALWNNGEWLLAEIRQALVEHATGRYVSFVDDDDEVPPYFVDEVWRALKSEPDQVGWQMQAYVDGVTLKPTYHSLRHGGWFEDDHGYYRDVSHLNPVRRDLALRCNFTRYEPPEDVSWVQQLREHVKTEAYVDRVMYHYHASSSDSTWRPGSVNPSEANYVKLVVDHPHFAWHPWSYALDPKEVA